MALNNKELMGYGTLGAVAALVTGFLLKTISQLLSMIPGLNVNLQSVSITTTGLGNVVNTGLGSYAQKLFGLVPIPITGLEMVYTAIGGALFVILGAYVADMLGMLKGSKVAKLATVFVIGGIAAGWILSMSIGIPAISGVIAMVVDALVLSWILVTVDDAAGTKLVP